MISKYFPEIILYQFRIFFLIKPLIIIYGQGRCKADLICRLDGLILFLELFIIGLLNQK